MGVSNGGVCWSWVSTATPANGGASVSGLGVAGLWLGSYEALHGLEGVRNTLYS